MGNPFKRKGKDPKPSTMLPELEITTNKKSGVVTTSVNKSRGLARRNMDVVSDNSPGPRSKFANAVGKTASNMVGDLIARKAGKLTASAGIQAAKELGHSYSIPGQDIGQDGKSMYDMESGPRKGDLIYGRHLKRSKDNIVEDYDYKLKPGKKEGTWKTTGIK
tara:strand:+ start:575 stop:1063 length:489 start_codon:yes stop_codon:yes gene_type:complete